MTWQPIGTAPKDGTLVLLWMPERKQPCSLGWFSDTKTYNHGELTFSSQRWVLGDQSFILGEDPRPSHWAPFPDGPSEFDHMTAKDVQGMLDGIYGPKESK